MMKKLFVLAAVVTLSTNIFAGTISEDNDMKAMHSKMKDKQSFENILQNEDMQRLHRDMTINAMSEGGMEARLEMMKEEGRAYHKALEKGEKNTAG